MKQFPAALIRHVRPALLAIGVLALPGGAPAQPIPAQPFSAQPIPILPVPIEDGVTLPWDTPSCDPIALWRETGQPPAPGDLSPLAPAHWTPATQVQWAKATQASSQPSSQASARARALARSEARWSTEQAFALLRTIERIGAEGLDPADYEPEALRAGLASGAGPALDAIAGRQMARLVAHLRDGRTPIAARRRWVMTDPDAQLMPTNDLIDRALTAGTVASTLAALHPVHPDYAALREALALTPADDQRRQQLIRINMDRWRWLPRDLGGLYLLANVPQFHVRLVADGTIVSSHRAIVGAPGRRATPQMAETVSGVIFNPTWTAPQSIVVGQGLGARVLNNRAWAREQGFTATRGAGGILRVVQAPGPRNALGAMKLDMPNPHAIFFHDTPGKHLFAEENRALSNGCIRVEGAIDLAMLVVRLGEAGISRDEAQAKLDSGRYTKVALTRGIRAFIAYFTMARDDDGRLREFADIYERDGPVIAALFASQTPARR